MFSGGWLFTNYSYPEWGFWGGFTASNHTDLNQSGLNAQYTAATGGGYDGSTQYGVAYCMGVQADISGQSKGHEAILDLSQSPKGVFFVTVSQNGKTFVKKIIH